MKSLRNVFCICLFLLCVSFGQAQANPTLSKNSTVHLTPPKPIASLNVYFLSGFPDLLGLEVGVKVLDPIRIEAGASIMMMVALTQYIRGGYVFSPINTRNEINGRGWTLNLMPMLGARVLQMSSAGGPGSTIFGAEISGSVEIAYWMARHFGVELKLTGGGLVAFSFGKSGAGYLPFVRAGLGFTF